MRFKEWCFYNYGITGFAEAKIINRVFLPSIPKNRPTPGTLMLQFGGYMTTHQYLKGFTFTRQQYEDLLYTLEREYRTNHPGYCYPAEIINNANRYFYQLGFDNQTLMQFRTPPGIYITLDNEQIKQAFIQQFSSFRPMLNYDFLNQVEVIQMPASFLQFLYDAHYKNSKATILSKELSWLETRSIRLGQLLNQIERNNLTKDLNVQQYLALDYDNYQSSTVEACSAYAISLKIYAELHRDGLSQSDYNVLYAASNLLSARDRHGNLKQCLQSDACFVNYIRNKTYQTYLKSIDYNFKDKGLPLIDDLPQDTKEFILNEIDNHTNHILYGHSKTRLHDTAYIKTLRFLPDNNNHSDTDEIILRAGGQYGHSANFRLIKVAVFQSPEDHMNNNPHHYDYFKVENNLGTHCHQPNHTTKTCLGTYVTKLAPYSRMDNNSLIPLEINPFTHPDEYQAAMEETLKELIKVERQLMFYRPHPGTNNSDLNREEMEWLRLHQSSILLSGQAYNQRVYYCTSDALNPSVKYYCTVSNQRGYMQEGGSCPVFSIKSLVTSIVGHELAALHNHFMQQHDAFDYMEALQYKIAYYKKAIHKLSPMFITGGNDDIAMQIQKFRHMTGILEAPIAGLTLLSTPNPNESMIVIHNPWLKNLWNHFVNNENNTQKIASGQMTSRYPFFNQSQPSNSEPDTSSPGFHNPGL